jgi:hypothetical protein
MVDVVIQQSDGKPSHERFKVDLDAAGYSTVSAGILRFISSKSDDDEDHHRHHHHLRRCSFMLFSHIRLCAAVPR